MEANASRFNDRISGVEVDTTSTPLLSRGHYQPPLCMRFHRLLRIRSVELFALVRVGLSSKIHDARGDEYERKYSVAAISGIVT